MLVTSYLQREYKKGGTDKIDLGRHLINFFELYGQIFNYEHVGISIRKQGSYFSKEKRGWDGGSESQRKRLCVENPQDTEVDIGRPAFNIAKVQRAFQHAYDTLIYNNMNSVSLLKLIITANPKEMND
jgi:non-canonical poly(A) RNA polymerase PAPD5/7